MTRVRGLVVGVGFIFSAILLLGCESTENEVDHSLGSQVSSSVASAAISRIPTEGGMSEPQHQMFSGGSQGGISVSGSGSISVEIGRAHV